SNFPKFNTSEIRRRLPPLARSALCVVQDTSAAKALLAPLAPRAGNLLPGDPAPSTVAADVRGKDNRPCSRFFGPQDSAGGRHASPREWCTGGRRVRSPRARAAE